MDFDSPSVGELAWGDALEAKDEIKKLKQQIKALEEALAVAMPNITERLSALEEAIKHHA